MTTIKRRDCARGDALRPHGHDARQQMMEKRMEMMQSMMQMMMDRMGAPATQS